MTSENADTKISIDNYVADNPHCKLDLRSRTEFLDGELVTIAGYRLPRELIFYNKDNGRIAAEYAKLKRKNGGRDLDTTKKDDADKIQKLLLTTNSEGKDSTDTVNTYDSLQKGQLELGIITQDGFLIDGNRRMAIISKLSKDLQEPKYDFIDVARLDRNISDSDMWAIEAGISLGMDQKVRYGPINELLKLDSGIKKGYTPEKIAKMLYGGDATVIETKLKKLELMKEYLRDYYDGDDEDYTPLEQRDTHFEEFQVIDQLADDKVDDIEELQSIRKVAFRLIREQLNHRRLRDFSTAIRRQMPLDKVVEAADKMEPFVEKADGDKSRTSTEIRWMDFEDQVKAGKNSENSIILLNTILSNLEAAISSKDPKLKTDDSKTKIEKIKSALQELSSLVEV